MNEFRFGDDVPADRKKAAEEELRQSMLKKWPGVEEKVLKLIELDLRDLSLLEQMLNHLHAWLPYGVGQSAYTALLDHIKTFAPDGAARYWQALEKQKPL